MLLILDRTLAINILHDGDSQDLKMRLADARNSNLTPDSCLLPAGLSEFNNIAIFYLAYPQNVQPVRWNFWQTSILGNPDTTV